MDEKIELMARYLEARGWSMWTSADPRLNELHEIERAAYRQNHHHGNQVAVKAGYVAVLQAVFDS